MRSVLSLALLIKTTLPSLISKPNSVVLAVCLTYVAFKAPAASASADPDLALHPLSHPLAEPV